MNNAKKFIVLIVLVLVTLFIVLAEQEQNISTDCSKCVSSDIYKLFQVNDGDTIRLQTGIMTFNVRLFGIDAPELDQPFGNKAKLRVEKLLANQTINLEPKYMDVHGRMVARVKINNSEDLATILVQEGLAYWSKKHAQSDYKLSEAEKIARDKKLGVWSYKAVKPWEHRNK